ncbi:hypothetical protein [Lentzea sp. NPDC092896]|uniref:hypothetical protein n=1 Tax=Lentzea sp. NPDC092896 TaxID=3364127 RepID=UPI00380D7DFD
MQPGPAPLTKPTPPEFKLRKLMKVAYGMSVTTGGLGQVLFLGDKFGGTAPAYAAALFLAAFVEFCMVSSGDSSLHHRVDHEAWKLMLALSLGFAGYAAANQLLHFWHTDLALAVMFAGASVAGFLLHILDGHIRAAAYLRALAKWEAATAAPVGVPQQRSARQTTPRPATKPAPAAPRPEASAPTVTTPATDGATMPVLDPNPSEPGSSTGPRTDTNVRPISEGLSQREQVWRWFVEQVNAADGDVYAVKGADLVEQFGSEHLRKKISDLRTRYKNEHGKTAVNE